MIPGASRMAASSLAASGIPACAMCGLPPPLPPATAAISRTSASARTPRSRGRRSRPRAASTSRRRRSRPATPTPVPKLLAQRVAERLELLHVGDVDPPAHVTRSVAVERLGLGQPLLQLVPAAPHRLLDAASRARAAPRAAPVRAVQFRPRVALSSVRHPARATRSRSRMISNATGPVAASMRRTPAATPVSGRIWKRPISRRVPHVRAAAELHREVRASSRRGRRRRTSRRTAPSRPAARASAYGISSNDHRLRPPRCRDSRSRSISASLLGLHRTVVREVEAQPIGRDERAGLVHRLAEHLRAAPRAAGASRCGSAPCPCADRVGTRAATRPNVNVASRACRSRRCGRRPSARRRRRRATRRRRSRRDRRSARRTPRRTASRAAARRRGRRRGA